MYYHRVDAAQPAIVAELRKMGYTVVLTSRSGGDAPDFVAGKCGITVMVECKSPARIKEHKARLAKQAEARAGWQGDAYILASTTSEVVECFRRLHAERNGLPRPLA
jgi:Holliday junction resolvase